MSNIDLPTASRQFIEEFIQWSSDIKTIERDGEVFYDVYPCTIYMTRTQLLEYYLKFMGKERL